MSKKTIAILVVVGVLVVAGIGWLVYYNSLPGPYDDFAVCLGQKGAKFYGAFWCEACKAQKDLFGKSAKKLPYVECSAPDGRDQTQICRDKQITSYPTWEFSDSSKLVGVQEMTVLSEKTGCANPVIK